MRMSFIEGHILDYMDDLQGKKILLLMRCINLISLANNYIYCNFFFFLLKII